MATTFNFCGKIVLGKDNDKFHPIERRTFDSKWTNTTVKFNCVNEANRVPCMVQGGKWSDDDKKNVIKTFSKSTAEVKGQKIEIPWAKRFDEDQIAKVASFKRFTCDTGDVRMRYKLQNLIKAFEKGDETDEAMEECGVYTIDDAKAALEKSNAKKKVFISEWDFAEHMAKVVASDKFKDKLFYISGNYDIQYNADKDRFYTSYHVNKVTLAPDDATPSTEMKIDFLFGENAWDDSQYEDTGKCRVSGWITYYDINLKKNGFYPMVVTVKEDENKTNGFKRKFSTDDGIKQIGLTLKVIEGAEMVEVTMDMLDEETREDIELGLLDWETVKRKMGGRVAGNRVSEMRFVELTANKNKAEDTSYTIEDMHPAKAEEAVDLSVGDDFDDEL